MENLSISDQPPAPPAQGGQPQMQQSPLVPQLPPQMFITAASLLDLTDKKLMVVLRDGRKLIGVLRSWDQFANLVLQGTTERIFVPLITPDPPSPSEGQLDASPARPSRGLYADEARGLFVVRGENVLLLGEIDLDKDDDPPPGYEKAELEVVKRMAAERKAAEKTRNKRLLKGLATFGFEGENSGEIVY